MINIYKITNLRNNKIYIGQTINEINIRFNQHLRETRTNNQLHKDMQLQGKEDFIITLIDTADNQESADEKERFWITFYDSTNIYRGYNLDSGGKSNCKKSETALKPMREAVLRNWEDEDISKKMMEGLEKGTETWKKICKENRVKFICPVCGKELHLPNYELKNRNTCGDLYCKNKYAKDNKTYTKGLNKANEHNKEKQNAKSHEVKKFVLGWCENNKDIVLSCPKNKIVTTLKDLISEVQNEFNIRDIRSIAHNCCGSNSKIKFLEWMQSNIKNN